MAITTRLPASTAASVPRWVDRAAHVVPWTTVPSGLWRIALGFGVPVGFTGDLAELYRAPGWITPYVIALTLVTEALALLTLGLVKPWGEVLPRWIPVLGGRPIPVMAAAIPAGLGSVAVTWITVSSAFLWSTPANNGDPDAPHGFAALVMVACYAPLLAWGPLLAVVTVAYAVRRRNPRRQRHIRHDGGTSVAGCRVDQSSGRAAKAFFVCLYQPSPDIGCFHLSCMLFKASSWASSPPATASFK